MFDAGGNDFGASMIEGAIGLKVGDSVRFSLSRGRAIGLRGVFFPFFVGLVMTVISLLLGEVTLVPAADGFFS
jgi:hypothetical protein